jgi:hypothetical protein
VGRARAAAAAAQAGAPLIPDSSFIDSRFANSLFVGPDACLLNFLILQTTVRISLQRYFLSDVTTLSAVTAVGKML